jgi:ribosome recycling factor
MFNINDLQKKLQEATEWFKKELGTLRTGRASLVILDGINIDSYGTKTPLNQVANISIEDPKTVRITPWDKGQVQDIERAIAVADLGISTAADGMGVRVIFPDMTTERRIQISKLADGKLEEGKIRIRKIRESVINEIKDDGLSDDDAAKAKESVQKVIDEANKEFDSLAKIKKEEITTL